MLAADSSGWQKANSPDVANLDPLTAGGDRGEESRRSAHPREIPAGKYTVILEPAAVLDIVGFMFWDYSGMAILDQRSFLDRVASAQNCSATTLPFGTMSPIRCRSGSPFDGEGMRRQRLAVGGKRNGEAVVYARATAERMKRSEYKDKVGPIDADWARLSPCRTKWERCRMNIVFCSASASARPSSR